MIAKIFDCDVFSGETRIARIAPVVDALRQSCGQDGDMMTDLSWFVSRTVLWGNIPIVVLLKQHGVPVAAVLFYGRKVLGFPTGVIKGGNRSGDGVVIAPPDQRLPALHAASKRMLAKPWIHTVLASVRSESGQDAADAARTGCSWQGRDVSTHLSLEGGFEGLLSRIRPRSRRNYRYFRRRAERELGLVFVPSLQPDQAVQAVQDLHAVSMYPVPRPRAMRLEAAIRATPGSFAMGVRDPAAGWLSYVSGWRQPGATFVEWQLNHREHEAVSLSTVMRTCILEHEAARGVPEIVFVGGTSPALGRYCAPAHCLDLLVARHGMSGFIVKQLLTRLRPQSQLGMILRGTLQQLAAAEADEA